jgi:hypothetical protein
MCLKKLGAGEHGFGFEVWYYDTTENRYGVEFEFNSASLGFSFENTGTPAWNRYHTFTLATNEGDFLHTDLTREFKGDLSAGLVTLTDGTDEIVLEVGANCRIKVDDGVDTYYYTSTHGITVPLDKQAFAAAGFLSAGLTFNSGGSFDFTDTGGVVRHCLYTDGQYIITTTTSIGEEAIRIDQNDTDMPFIDYQGNTGANATASISTYTGGNSVQGHIQIEINGVKRWVRFYDDPTT